MGDDFFAEYAGAMRVGAPGPCYGVEGRARTWHTLDPAAVEELRDLGVGGGLAPCLDCRKMIFVPGKPDAGMTIHGLPERFAPKLGGVDAKTGDPLDEEVFCDQNAPISSSGGIFRTDRK